MSHLYSRSSLVWWLFQCRLQMYVFFSYNRLFSASQNKCHTVLTPEENAANGVPKCYFIYTMDIFFFFNITCKSKRTKQKRYSATECLLALLRNWQKLLQIGLKLGAKISCKSINSTNSNLHLPLHWWEYAEVWEMETKEMFQLQKERKLYP